MSEVVVAVTYDGALYDRPLTDGHLISASLDEMAEEESLAKAKLMEEIQKHMRDGKYVLVRGWRPDQNVYWSKQSIKTFKGSMGRKVDFQSKYRIIL